jgi:hypothetical protein
MDSVAMGVYYYGLYYTGGTTTDSSDSFGNVK